MSVSGAVCLLRNHELDPHADVARSRHCMFPANALNGPVGSSGNLLGAGHQSIPGSTDFTSTSASNILNRSHGSAGLSSLFPGSSKDINVVRAGFDQVNSKDAGLMPPTLSGNSFLPSVGAIGNMPAAMKFRASDGPVLSENEFPSLTSRSPAFGYQQQSFKESPSALLSSASSSSLSALSRAPYAQLITKSGPDSTLPPTNSASEFHIQNEDFPALPGAPQNDSQSSSALPVAAASESAKDARFPSDLRQLPPQQPKKGIQTQPDGLVTGIPAGMLNDQFGMAGLLTFLRAIETDPGIVALALGHDLTTLGLNLNAAEKTLYQNFGGPWADVPCRMQDVDYHVPEEYLTNVSIREKLPPIKLNRFQDDVLFYLFYNCPGEVFQMAAAVELYSRDWRYYKDERVWLTRAPGQVTEQTGTYERGMYYVFDPATWRKLPKEMTLEYSRLEERPLLPPQLQPQPGQSAPAPS